tara:strand:+ start:236 stop:940 length:705 start_codon:yes stop_codon:yes gene_type:complete
MKNIIKYPGKELELFDKANFFRFYIYLLIKKYIGKKVIEVGAGIGSFTKVYLKKNINIIVSETDKYNLNTLKRKFKGYKNIKVQNKLIKQFNGSFDTILYLNVLEHIKEDKKEISDAIKQLKYLGHLVICVPAHDYMYSKFDKEIGHYRRYNINFFDNLKLKNAIVKKKYFIDSSGHLLYYLNKIFFSKETYPSKFKIMIWDKIFMPITYILDFLSFYTRGKNIICVIKKISKK